jgi:hypothetical protein
MRATIHLIPASGRTNVSGQTGNKALAIASETERRYNLSDYFYERVSRGFHAKNKLNHVKITFESRQYEMMVLETPDPNL